MDDLSQWRGCFLANAIALTMKGKPFHHRLGFALQGWRYAYRLEASFRFQLLAAIVAITFTLWMRPPLYWLALVIVMVALVLAAELINTALEQILDGLHAEHAEFVKIAKDCAAGAVLVLSLAALAVFLLMLGSMLF